MAGVGQCGLMERDLPAEIARRSDWYFTQALTQPGFPIFTVKARGRGDSVTVQLEQVQDEPWGVYRLPGMNDTDYRAMIRGLAYAPKGTVHAIEVFLTLTVGDVRMPGAGSCQP